MNHLMRQGGVDGWGLIRPPTKEISSRDSFDVGWSLRPMRRVSRDGFEKHERPPPWELCCKLLRSEEIAGRHGIDSHKESVHKSIGLSELLRDTILVTSLRM